MSHDTKEQAAGYDWSDPHHFHHGEDAPYHEHGVHAMPWQLLFSILIVLLALTALTVGSAQAETWLIGMGVHISHFWNVVIAMSIALVKATLVCMYFMHLKHDNPLNTMILLTTLFVFGLFLLFTGIDLYERDALNPYRAEYIEPGGTGVGISSGGVPLTSSIVEHAKQKRIDKYALETAEKKGHLDPNGVVTPTEEDILAGEHKFWFGFYDKKYEAHPEHLPGRDIHDENDHHADWVAHHEAEHGSHHTSTASHSFVRHGRTPGLFSTEEEDHGAGHESGDDHDDGDH